MPLRLVVAVALCLTSALARGSDEPGAERKPGMISRIMGVFRRSPEQPGGSDRARWKDLVMTMSIAPQPVKLSEVRQMKVSLQLTNKSKKLVQLEFPTTQRIEVLVRNANGKLIEQWSEDQAFSNEPTLVAINPGERLEYSANVSTRDLTAGERYSVEAFFPNFEQLKATSRIVPEK